MVPSCNISGCLRGEQHGGRSSGCPAQKLFGPQQTCTNAAGHAPLAFGLHQRLILPGHVHVLLVCLFPTHILVLMGQTMVKSML